MKKIILFSVILMFTQLIDAQTMLCPGVNYTYMKHSKLHGISLSNDAIIGKFLIGFDLSYAEGNRNFDRDKKGNYNFEYEDYVPQFQYFQVPSLQFDYPTNYSVKTSTTYQFTLKSGYSFQKELEKGIVIPSFGVYGTYVNKTYIAEILRNTDLIFHPIPFVDYGDEVEVDMAFPFHIRYLDIGAFVGLKYEFDSFPIGISANYFFGFEENGWLNLGIFYAIRI